MKIDNIKNYTRGWIAGSFNPALIKTDKYELGVKTYKAGDKEKPHRHNLSDEITIVCSGIVKINGEICEEGSIVIQQKGDIADFECLLDAVLTVFRPDGSYPNDKEFV